MTSAPFFLKTERAGSRSCPPLASGSTPSRGSDCFFIYASCRRTRYAESRAPCANPARRRIPCTAAVLADFRVLILVVERLGALGAQVYLPAGVRALDRLTAAVDAAARAAHDLHERVVALALLDLLAQLFGVGETRSDRDLDLDAVQIVLRFLDALDAAHLLEVDVIQRLARPAACP